MKVEEISLSLVSEDPANVRRHEKRNLEAIRESLRKFGQQKPIVIDSKGTIIAGNGTYVAAKELGWDRIKIVRSELIGVDKKAYAIADNRTGELAEWNDQALEEALRSLAEEDFDISAIGFNDEELESMIDEGGLDSNYTPDESSNTGLRMVTLQLTSEQYDFIWSVIKANSETKMAEGDSTDKSANIIYNILQQSS